MKKRSLGEIAMAKYSLIALDIDGTLLNSKLELTEGNREAVHRAHAAGKHIVLSTGRCMAELKEIMKALPEIRYIVCENGCCVYDAKYEYALHLAPVPAEDIIHILNLVKNEEVALQAFHDNAVYFDQPNGDWTGDYGVGVYKEVFNRTALWDERLFDTFEKRPFQVEKLNLYFRHAADQQRIHKILEPRKLKLADSIGHMLEVVSDQADKGRGLEILCRHIGVPMEETIAVGDSMNDIEILRAAGLSAAMGNACEEAKAAADIVTADCDHDGVARVIEEYLLAE